MKRLFRTIKQHALWFLIILAAEGFPALLLWLADIRAFKALFPVLLLFTLFLFIIASFSLMKKAKRKEEVLQVFLLNPDGDSERALLDAYGPDSRDSLLFLAETIYQKQANLDKADLRLADYEDYVERWAHEIKLPLSLLTLILDNQSDALPAELSFKLDYIRNQIQSNISQILFYYRVKSEKQDYFLEDLSVQNCLEEVLEDYAPLIHEKSLKVTCQNLDQAIYTDRRGFEFMVGQLISNSLKYSGLDPRLEISMQRAGGKMHLRFKDNGQGVKACDLPYIFEKGFTGDSGEIRKKSTGMGLYLVKQLADDLNIELVVSSDWQKGFTIELVF